MLVVEFGVDSTPQGRDALRNGREQWRRMQVRAVVRDVPGEAIAALEALGYSVQLGRDMIERQENLDRLHDL